MPGLKKYYPEIFTGFPVFFPTVFIGNIPEMDGAQTVIQGLMGSLLLWNLFNQLDN